MAKRTAKNKDPKVSDLKDDGIEDLKSKTLEPRVFGPQDELSPELKELIETEVRRQVRAIAPDVESILSRLGKLESEN